MRRILWLLLAAAVLWALYRTALTPDATVPTTGGETETGDGPGRRLAYLLSPERPLILKLSHGALQIRVTSWLDLPRHRFRGPEEEHEYKYRVRFLRTDGKQLSRRLCWGRTRKLLVPDPDGEGTLQNVRYGGGPVMPCEARSVVLAVPAGTDRIELQWPEQPYPSASVVAYEQLRSKLAPGELEMRWRSLSAPTRERLREAHALAPVEPTLQERIQAMETPWKRLLPLGNPGQDYERRHLYLAEKPVELPEDQPVPAGEPAGPAASWMRSWLASVRTTAPAPVVQVAGGARDLPVPLRIVARVPLGSGTTPGQVKLEAELLGATDRPAGRTALVLPLALVPGEQVRVAGASVAPMARASAVIWLSADVSRARIRASPDALLAFYTRLPETERTVDVEEEAEELDEALEESPARSSRRTWHYIRPLNARALEEAGAAPLLALEPTALATAAPDRAASEAAYIAIAPGRAEDRVRLLEPVGEDPAAPWDGGTYGELTLPGPWELSLRHPDHPGRPVALEARLLYWLPSPDDLGRELRVSIRGGPGVRHLAVTRRGRIEISAPSADRGMLDAEGFPAGSRLFVNLPPADHDAAMTRWKVRTYHLVRPGRPVDLDIEREPEDDAILNLVFIPFLGASGGETVVRARLEGEPPRPLQLFPRSTDGSVRLVLPASEASGALCLERSVPALSRARHTTLRVDLDSPPGSYRWKLGVVEGQGALVRSFRMGPPDAGRVWVSSRL